MTERLDRIEAILESTAQQQAATDAKLDRAAEQQAKNSDDIETLLGAVSTNDVAVRQNTANVDRLIVKIDESNQRFDIQRGEAQADRQETRRLFNDAITQMERDRTESRNRFEAMLTELRDAQRKADERHAKQMEVIQTLLIELAKTNGNIIAVNSNVIAVSSNVNNLRDRLNNLEQAG